MKKNVFNWASGFPILVFLCCLAWVYFYPSESGSDAILRVIYGTIVVCICNGLGLILGVISLLRKEPNRLVGWIFILVNIFMGLGLFFMIFGF